MYSHATNLHHLTDNTAISITMNLISIIQDRRKKTTLKCNSHSNVYISVVAEALSISAASIYNRVLG